MALSTFIPNTLPYLLICRNKKPRVCNCTYIYTPDTPHGPRPRGYKCTPLRVQIKDHTALLSILLKGVYDRQLIGLSESL